jgi:hypothetical protein
MVNWGKRFSISTSLSARTVFANVTPRTKNSHRNYWAALSSHQTTPDDVEAAPQAPVGLNF